jgi:putative hydrolases of HD superfamily
MVDSNILQLLLQGNQLKRTARTGWVQRGIVGAEDVAAHSYGVTFIILVFSHVLSAKIDRQKALSMAILHDLPEGVTTDIPTPAWEYLPPDIKTDVERAAMMNILGDVSCGPELMAFWEELHLRQSPEALLVHDADKLDMYLQALIYEQQTGNRQLAEFWVNPYQFAFPEMQAIFDRLLSLRNEE